MSMNYTQLTQAIQDWTENSETSFVSNIPNFVRRAEERIYTSVQLPVLRDNALGNVTANNRYLTLPSDFLAPYALAVIENDGTEHWLLYKDSEWIREAFSDPTDTGIPRYYAIFNKSNYILAQTPDSSYTVELHYYRHPQSIVDAGTSWLGDNYDVVLLDGCLVEAYMYLKGEKEQIEFADSKFKEGLALLKRLGDGMDRQDTYRVEQARVQVK